MGRFTTSLYILTLGISLESKANPRVTKALTSNEIEGLTSNEIEGWAWNEIELRLGLNKAFFKE